jgi:hypothetical protein
MFFLAGSGNEDEVPPEDFVTKTLTLGGEERKNSCYTFRQFANLGIKRDAMRHWRRLDPATWELNVDLSRQPAGASPSPVAVRYTFRQEGELIHPIAIWKNGAGDLPESGRDAIPHEMENALLAMPVLGVRPIKGCSPDYLGKFQ